MFIPSINLPSNNIKTEFVNQTKPLNFANKELKQDTVSFSGNINSYLSKEVLENGQKFKESFLKLLCEENSSSQLSDKLNWFIKLFFKDFNFELKDIKQSKFKDIIENPPLVFSQVNFSQASPKTDLFINFDKIEKTRENAIDPKRSLAKFVHEITEVIYGKNDLSFISKVIDELGCRLNQAGDLDLKSVREVLDKLVKDYGLDVNFEVVNKKSYPIFQDKFGEHLTFSSLDSNGNVKSVLGIDFDKNRNGIIEGIVHEYTHAMNVLSQEIKPVIFPSDKYEQIYFSLIKKFERCNNLNFKFFEKPPVQRALEYLKIIKEIMAECDIQNKNKIFSVLENIAKNESLAYQKSTRALEKLQSNPCKNSMNFFYKDFFNYTQFVKYNSQQFNEIIGSKLPNIIYL